MDTNSEVSGVGACLQANRGGIACKQAPPWNGVRISEDQRGLAGSRLGAKRTVWRGGLERSENGMSQRDGRGGGGHGAALDLLSSLSVDSVSYTHLTLPTIYSV